MAGNRNRGVVRRETTTVMHENLWWTLSYGMLPRIYQLKSLCHFSYKFYYLHCVYMISYDCLQPVSYSQYRDDNNSSVFALLMSSGLQDKITFYFWEHLCEQMSYRFPEASIYVLYDNKSILRGTCLQLFLNSGEEHIRIIWWITAVYKNPVPNFETEAIPDHRYSSAACTKN